MKRLFIWASWGRIIKPTPLVDQKLFSTSKHCGEFMTKMLVPSVQLKNIYSKVPHSQSFNDPVHLVTFCLFRCFQSNDYRLYLLHCFTIYLYIVCSSYVIRSPNLSLIYLQGWKMYEQNYPCIRNYIQSQVDS